MGQYLTTATNMASMGVNSTAEIEEANDPALRYMRLFTVAPSSSPSPYADLNAKELLQGCRGVFKCDGVKDVACASKSMTEQNYCPCKADPPAPTGSIFALSLGNDMVLQHDAPVVFGFAVAGSTVSVGLDGIAMGKSTADQSGAWSFSLPKQLASGNAHSITASSGNTNETLTGVLFGQTWLCSGQSNMVIRVLN